MSDFYYQIKKEILDRHDSRLKECRDTKAHDEIMRAQGRAQELFELVSIMDLMENPVKDEEKS